ncbi:hypothetical protein HHK36_012235 [Tetracentron sinense]|uniref:EF-hand domain-containing protein n=2 Tax=Tetracentron sinense TaxID=13715 RepID=A0A834ZF05_TETSI|nr:hypothetical protein HHK36_012235 [Tetracentron sinense]
MFILTVGFGLDIQSHPSSSSQQLTTAQPSCSVPIILSSKPIRYCLCFNRLIRRTPLSAPAFPSLRPGEHQFRLLQIRRDQAPLRPSSPIWKFQIYGKFFTCDSSGSSLDLDLEPDPTLFYFGFLFFLFFFFFAPWFACCRSVETQQLHRFLQASALRVLQFPFFRRKDRQTRRRMCPSGTTPRPESAARPDIRRAFDILDTDRDGKISPNDLRTFYAGFSSGSNTTTSDEDISSMISVADSNKDGFVEFDEFERVLNCRRSSARNGVMEDVFRVMDKDEDGKVGFDDLRSYMKLAGFPASDDDILAMITLAGGNEKVGVCFEGLLKILAVDFAG